MKQLGYAKHLGVNSTCRAGGRRPDSLIEANQNPFYLPRVNFERAAGPDYKIGAGDFLFYRHLGGVALLDLFRRPTARLEPFVLRRRRAGNTNDFIEV